MKRPSKLPPGRRAGPRKTAVGTRPPAEAQPREIPLRELRNDVSRILQEAAAGARFVVTVRGQPVAQIAPVGGRRVWVPWHDVVKILAGTTPDDSLLAEVD